MAWQSTEAVLIGGGGGCKRDKSGITFVCAKCKIAVNCQMAERRNRVVYVPVCRCSRKFQALTCMLHVVTVEHDRIFHFGQSARRLSNHVGEGAKFLITKPLLHEGFDASTGLVGEHLVWVSALHVLDVILKLKRDVDARFLYSKS